MSQTYDDDDDELNLWAKVSMALPKLFMHLGDSIFGMDVATLRYVGGIRHWSSRLLMLLLQHTQYPTHPPTYIRKWSVIIYNVGHSGWRLPNDKAFGTAHLCVQDRDLKTFLTAGRRNP